MTKKSHITKSTADVQDRLCEVSRKVRLLGLAVSGMEEANELDTITIAELAHEIEEEIDAIAKEVHPHPSPEEPEEPDEDDNVVELVS
jgi:hypothetical protein